MKRLLIAIALAALPVRVLPRADIYAGTSKEYQVKAAFLFHFAQFVAWPDRAFRLPGDPFVIGILGTDPFGPYLDEVVRGEKIGARPIAIKRCGGLEDIGGCQILFLSGTDARAMIPVLSALRKRPILTVGEADGFSRNGGMIRFRTERDRIRLRANPEASLAAGLAISSKLLNLADIVAPGKD